MDNKVKATQKITHSRISLFLRKFSVHVAKYLHDRWVEPHQVVYGRTILLWVSSLYLLYQNNYLLQICWLIFIVLNSFFDMVDGDMARNYDKKTAYGGFLDEWLDGVLLNTVIFTFCIKFILQWYESTYIIWAAAALFWIIWSTKINRILEYEFWINCISGNNQIEAVVKEKRFGRMSTLFYEFMTPKNLFLSLFSNFRYYLLFWIIFQYIHLAVLIYWIAINIRWIVLFIALARYYKGVTLPTRSIYLFERMQVSYQELHNQ